MFHRVPLRQRFVPFMFMIALALPSFANPLEEVFLDDRATRDHIIEVGERCLDDEQTVTNEQLQAQLERATCALAVPTAAPVEGPLIPQIEAATLIISELYLCGNCDNFHANSASGFLISADGLAITNHHVLKSENELSGGYVAITRDGRALPVMEVLAANEAADVALIRLAVPEGVELTALPLAESSQVGETVHCVSHPDGRYYTYSTGVITRRFIQEQRVDREMVQTPRISVTAEYARGSSGAAMVNEAGEVVGLVTTTNSVYYTEENGEQRDLQMVFRNCVPVESIRTLFAGSDAARD